MDAVKPIGLELSHRLKVLRWLIPLVFFIGSLLYQFGFARWISIRFGEQTHYWAEIAFYTSAGSIIAYWTLSVIQRWIEKSERVENEARMIERRMASITSASADAILSLDLSGHIHSWNKGAEALFGYLEEEMLDVKFSTLLAGLGGATAELEWLMENIQRNHFIKGHETICRHSSGGTFHVELTGTKLIDHSGDAVGASLILRDITARKKREAEIQRLNTSLNQQVEQRTKELAEKVSALDQANQELQELDRMRSEFMALVTHQVRAPLTNMRGAISRMRDGCSSISPTCSRMFAIVDQQVIRLDRLVHRVLQAIRIEAEELVVHSEPLSLLPILKQAIDQTSTRSNGHKVHLPEKPGLPMIYADRDHVSEVLINLLDNAEKYSPDGGDLHIEIHATEDEVVLSIRDEGPGIFESDLEQIFKKYYRADSGDSQRTYGYGLGLFVCRSLIEAQGGRIWAENHPNGGAVFSISLPVWRE